MTLGLSLPREPIHVTIYKLDLLQISSLVCVLTSEPESIIVHGPPISSILKERTHQPLEKIKSSELKININKYFSICDYHIYDTYDNDPNDLHFDFRRVKISCPFMWGYLIFKLVSSK